ncbi:putative ABC transport system ATP-binding protein [Knoellia remsis]|uniref:Putative ABC transport system ATP-binding protein n=1 Tax=Knoellia remsis TaxID=407159 RepID=A0A2T0UJB6_9MICO|nr:ABC transporter ATP-binding protein [Knoellia remsis]PRY57974.1 putative ABC transport system ATP-binding protein [Knoellia remsis]
MTTDVVPERSDSSTPSVTAPDGQARRRVAARVTDLVKTYGSGDTAVRALDGVSLDIAAGEFTAIMGPSGSGKSTLMHCAAGLDSVTSGVVKLGRVDLTALREKDLTKVRRDYIGFIFQSFNLIPTLSAQENIVLPLSIAGRKPDPEWFDTVIDTVGLRDRLTHRPGELSGGQQQRVACARALVSRPAVIFADEPTGNLDSTSGAEVLAFLRRSVDEFGQTIVMVTHDPGAASWTDRVVFLADGQIVTELREPTPDLILETMKSLDAREVRGAQGEADGIPTRGIPTSSREARGAHGHADDMAARGIPTTARDAREQD